MRWRVGALAQSGRRCRSHLRRDHHGGQRDGFASARSHAGCGSARPWPEWLGEKAVAESALKTLLCPIQAAPWRFGRSIGGSAMLETIARTCSHRDRSAELGGRTIKNPPNAFQHLHDSRHNAGGVARFCDRLYRLEPINEALTGIARQRATKGKNPRHRVAGEHLCNYCSCWF